nr:MAG TPA: hypothetical protein [Caudoviricetes sp.]
MRTFLTLRTSFERLSLHLQIRFSPQIPYL